MPRREHVDRIARPGRLRTTVGRADEALAHRVGADRRRQRAGDAADRAVEREFAERREAGNRIRRDRAHRRHQGERDGEVVVAALLRQVGGRQIDSQVLERQPQADRMQRVTDALPALRDRLVGQPDDGEGLRPRRDPYLHLDRPGFDADERHRGDMPIHALPPLMHRNRPIARLRTRLLRSRSLGEAPGSRQEQ